MKVKNIMFAGFAAAIFASFANAADAATYNLASKEYVDEQNKLDVKKADAKLEEVTDAAGFISSVSQEDGIVDAKTTKFVTDVAANPTSEIAPQTVAVKTYVDTQDAAVKKYVDDQDAAVKKYVDDQDALDEKVANKVETAAELQTINAMADGAEKTAKKETSYTSVAVAEEIAAEAAQNATGTINIEAKDAADGKFFSKVGIKDGEMDTATTDFVTDVAANPTSAIAPQTAAVKKYVDDQDALDVKKADAKLDEVTDAAGFISSVSQENGIVDAATTKFVTDVAANPTSEIAPQTAAVKTYVDNAIDEVNSGFDWLDSADTQKQYIVQTDKDGNEVLVEIAIIGKDGDPIYTEVTAPSNTGETPEGN